jgi:hypothetical protein
MAQRRDPPARRGSGKSRSRRWRSQPPAAGRRLAESSPRTGTAPATGGAMPDELDASFTRWLPAAHDRRIRSTTDDVDEQRQHESGELAGPGVQGRAALDMRERMSSIPPARRPLTGPRNRRLRRGAAVSPCALARRRMRASRERWRRRPQLSPLLRGAPKRAPHGGPKVIAGGDRQSPSPRPPSTTRRWPVTKPAASEAKKLTAWAMSSRVPMRPAGTEAR